MGIRVTRRSTTLPGKHREAVELAGRIADYVQGHFGIEVTWGGQIGGEPANIYWYTDYDDMAHVQGVTDAMWDDEAYQRLLDETTDFFVGAHVTPVYTQ